MDRGPVLASAHLAAEHHEVLAAEKRQGHHADRCPQRLVVFHRPAGPAAPARGLCAVTDLRGVDQRRCQPFPERDRQLLRHAGPQRLRQLPPASGGRDAAPDDGRLPDAHRQPQGALRLDRQAHAGARRELRPRSDAALHHRAGAAEPGRHAEEGCPRPAHSHLQQQRRDRPGARLHRLELEWRTADPRVLLPCGLLRREHQRA